MFGKIISSHEYTVTIENTSGIVETSVLGMHVVFEGKYKVIGEITEIKEKTIECVLVGEFLDGKFLGGMTHKPSGNAKIRLVNRDEVFALVGEQSVDSKENIYIGKSLTYDGFNVSAKIDDFFSNHFAILGNTGSGKSCTVTRLFQNLFYRKTYRPRHARIVLFDVYGEYKNAFETINKLPDCRYKTLTTDINAPSETIITIPPYFLEVDDLALLLNVDNPAQIPILQKALRYVYLFTEEESVVLAYKNNIIAKALKDILTSGKAPAIIRDQIIAVLSTFNTKSINLESEIVQPGYIRTIRQCLNIDETGKINAISLVTEFVEKFINEELKLTNNMKPKKWNLKDLYDAFEFALISEGVLKSDRVYDINNILKVRLDAIINSNNYRYFDTDEYITKEDYIKRLFTSKDDKDVQLLNLNLNFIDERFAKVLTKIFSKLFFDHAVSLRDKDNYSIQIILEEAHRYVQSDSDTDLIGYNIFDRITKEGRKYGVVLGLITQRPCELSKTSLSQCSNFIVLRMFHPDDLEIVKNITHSISESDIEKIKSLGPGNALVFGSSMNIPLFARIDPPNPFPNSFNAHIKDDWF